jgi:hypothetical protein
VSRVPIPTPRLLKLLALFDRAQQSIAGVENVRLQGIPGWELFRGEVPRDPQLEPWFERIGDAGFYVVEADLEPVPVEIEYDDDGTIGYHCPDTFRHVPLPEQEVGVYVVKPQPLLTLIADLLDIAQADRRQLDTVHLDGALWYLGPARLGQVRTGIWLARDTDGRLPDLLRFFNDRTLPEDGLVLTCGNPPPEIITPPRAYRFASLPEVLIPIGQETEIDTHMLERILTAPAGVRIQPSPPIHYDSHTQTLTIRGIPEPWQIRGERQAQAVRYMYEQWLKGRVILDAAEILNAAYPPSSHSRSRKMQSLFSGSTRWRTYIASPERGKYGFNTP